MTIGTDAASTPAAPSPEDGTRPPLTGRDAWLAVPNLLSLGRLVLTPVLGWLIIVESVVIATALFAVMGITDYLDGQIARRTNTVTDLGTTLDPVSDRVLVMTALVTMMIAGMLPLWLGIPVLLRDGVLSLAFLSLARRGFGKPKVRRVGKSATFALLTAMPMLVLGDRYEVLRTLGIAIFAVGAVLYFVAGFRYYQDMREFLAHQRRPFTT